MKTCGNCGCYIPDLWDTCPACHGMRAKAIKNNAPIRANALFKVGVQYRNGETGETFFTQRRNAINYACRTAPCAGVYSVEVWDCQIHERILTL